MAHLKGPARPRRSLLGITHLFYHDREIQLRDQASLLPHHPICADPMLGWCEGLQPGPATNLLYPQHGKYLASRHACARPLYLSLPIRIVSGQKHYLFGRIFLVIRKEGMSLYGVPVGLLTSHSLSLMGQVQEEQRKGLLQRPADLALIIYLILAGFFTLFRGLVSLASLCLSCLQPPSLAFPSHICLLSTKGSLLSPLIIREILN